MWKPMRIVSELSGVFKRNKKIVGVVALAFFSTLVVAVIVSYLLLTASPQVLSLVEDFIASQRDLMGLPSPMTSGFYWFIFLNNTGHFWNPGRVWVWIPLVGAFSLGYELILNAVLIGAVASYATLTRGPAFAMAGLTPHGVVELPAFILEFAAAARWHITSCRALYAKIGGRQVDRPLLWEGAKDTLILSAISVALFAIAAYIETFITPGVMASQSP